MNIYKLLIIHDHKSMNQTFGLSTTSGSNRGLRRSKNSKLMTQVMLGERTGGRRRGGGGGRAVISVLSSHLSIFIRKYLYCIADLVFSNFTPRVMYLAVGVQCVGL